MSANLENLAAAEATPWGFLRRQYTKPLPLPPSTTLQNQTAIIVGSNTGLGLEACRQLLSLHLRHLIMGVRSQTKGNTSAALLRTEFPTATISVWIVDLENYASMRAFAEKCRALDTRIDIAILNAGLVRNEFGVVAATTHEVTLQVNYLSTVFLTLLLGPILIAKRNDHVGNSKTRVEPPVLSIVTSDAAHNTTRQSFGLAPILESFDDRDAFSGFDWYCKSKLLQVIFVAKLAERVRSSDLIVNTVNPAMTKGTSFFDGVPRVVRIAMRVAQAVFARSVAVGASVYVYAAVAAGEESHGGFVGEWRVKAWPGVMYGEEGRRLGERVWEETRGELEGVGGGDLFEGF
ncbi:NAD(P)-binding protein [Amniculicola lignicola CBS 123094]|uniref:NAD(P)-binding protein n=1 Tax=Amniculicola lignicola CBS 123094 TaxID=1392246 RepID=A0A6A5WM50_9PLEO|nr:NAD(P)-binding protein [Amniculicola lignicola CBS 123094]